MKTFPSGRYGRQMLNFYPAPFKAPLRAFAVLVFAWRGDEVLVCDIADRGWCVPSGRVDPGENSLEAAIREAREEAGAELRDVQYIGCYQIKDRNEVRWADCFAAHVAELNAIIADQESMDRKLVSYDALPDIYHLWNDLTALVFTHSREILRRSEQHAS